MPAIHCKATLFYSATPDRFGTEPLLSLPKSASAQLPSRGMTMVKGTINGVRFHAALEPDGHGSHWFKLDKSLRDAAGAAVGDTVTLEIESTKEWPEPKLPADFKKALAADPEAYLPWQEITPAARWDWIRWSSSAKQTETRDRRINVACSMLKSGKRRPCCFDRNQCTLTDA